MFQNVGFICESVDSGEKAINFLKKKNQKNNVDVVNKYFFIKKIDRYRF